ncbi:WD40 repeat domain-containing protein [Sphingomonas sp. UYP23]
MIATKDILIDHRGRRWSLDAPVTAVSWIENTAMFALGDGSVRIVFADGTAKTTDAGCGSILCAALHPDGRSLLVGGDTGAISTVSANGDVALFAQLGTKWVDHLIANPASGIVAASVGREAIVWSRGVSTPSHRYEFVSTVGGLALDAKGKRLAVAHYGGASLFYPASTGGSRVFLPWDGSHIACTIHPEAQYVVTGTQETGLHGWKLPLASDMHMNGYRGKTRSFSWSKRAKWLATSGDAQVVIWPFEGKTGPMGKTPLLVGDRGKMVTQVAYHPNDDMLAVGYADGAVLLVRTADDKQMMVDDDDGEVITSLAWNASATLLAYGGESGRAGILDLTVRA